MIYNIVSLVNEETVNLEELEGFSEDLNEMVKRFSESYL